MFKNKKAILTSVLGFCVLATGCVSNADPINPIDPTNPVGPTQPTDDEIYDYDFPYYITDTKAMETEDVEDPIGKKHLYVRAWDCKNTTQKDGYYGLQRAGEYTFNNFDEAFKPDTKLYSYEPITGDTVDAVKASWKNELDTFFGDNEENDMNYVVLSCTGDGNGNLQIFDDYTTGGNKKVAFSDVVKWFNNYKGKFFFVLTAAYSGRLIRSDAVVNVIKSLNKEKYTIITGPALLQSDETYTFSSPYSYKSTSDTTIVLPSDLGSQLSVGLTKNAHDKFVADLDSDGNLTVEELFMYTRTAYGSSGTFCEAFGANIEGEVLLSDYNLDLYSLTSGSLINDGQEKLSIKVPNNKIINSIGMPNIKDGYKFTGWSYDREGNDKVTFPIVISSNTELFANYENKNGSKPGYINASKLDKIRIPYVDGTYNDFYILDFKTNEGNDGMFVVSADLAGMTKYPADGVTKNYYFAGTAAEAWCQEYIRRFFPDTLNNLIIPCNAPLGSSDPTKRLENAKMFFLSREEVQGFLNDEILRLPEDYLLRSDNTTNNDQVKASGDFKLYNKSVTDVKGTRPAMNLNISREDLGYDETTKTYYIKSVGKYVKTTPKRYDGTYTVKVDGEVVYTATGNRKLACDNMNSLASSPWETTTPWVYKDGYGIHLFKPGKYRGTLYTTNLRDFYDYEHIEECFVGTQVHGLDCAAAVSAAYTLTFGKKFLRNVNVAPKDEYLYGVIEYAADAIDPGVGEIPEYNSKKVNSTTGEVTYSSTAKHYDIVSVVGNPATPTMPDNETTLFQQQLAADLEAAGKNIYEEVFLKIRPGDAIVSRGKEYNASGVAIDKTSHARMAIGMEVFHDKDGHIDTANSKVYYADTSTPKSGRFVYGGESTSYCTFDTYSSKKTNSMTFDYLLKVGYLPMTLNDWDIGFPVTPNA